MSIGTNITSKGKPTGISLFTGGGLCDIGMQKWVTMVAGFELDEEIASHATSQLGHNVFPQDVRTANFRQYRGVDYVHASPPCTNASRANTNGGETPLDLELAFATIRAIFETGCTIFTLENVWQYREFQSFHNILAFLKSDGWTVHYACYDAADFGVAQHRERLMLRAWKSRAGLPQVVATHGSKSASYQQSLFDAPTLPWIGWYEAVADLLDSCPDSKLAPWQVRRLAAQYGENWLEAILQLGDSLIAGGSLDSGSLDSGSLPLQEASDPAGVVKATSKEATKALLVGGSGFDGKVAHCTQDEPAMVPTTTITPGAYRAVLVEETTCNSGKNIGTRPPEEPAPTVPATPTHRHRAVLVEGDACGERCPTTLPPPEHLSVPIGSGGGRVHRAILVETNGVGTERCPTVRADDEPSWTVRTIRQDETRAVLVHGAIAVLVHGANAGSNGKRGHDAEEPSFCLSASDCSSLRAIIRDLTIRVVSLTTRCLARLQSMPDDYILPEKRTLATKIIGNGVPCQMASAIFGTLFNDSNSPTRCISLQQEVQ